MSVGGKYEKLLEKYKKMGVLGGVAELLEWDQETYMPPKEAESRAEQLAFISEIIHSSLTDKELYELASELNGLAEKDYLDEMAAANVREAFRQIRLARALPADLVFSLARQNSLASNVWREARQNNNWNLFAPALKTTLKLTLEAAAALQAAGIGATPYEALFSDYEWGIPIARVDEIFSQLRQELPVMVKKVLAAKRAPSDSVLFKNYDDKKQEVFSREVITAMGFDWQAGRLDVSTHPFSTSTGYRITRITSRYRKDYIGDSIFSAIHEAGHALYEQNLPADWAYRPIGDHNGLSIHESQSRFWEAWIGRSYEFWQCFFPRLEKLFPRELYGIDRNARTFYCAVNKAKAGFIRVDSDPLTYNLHVLLRYDIEQLMVNGQAEINDLPEIWNQKFEDYFGIRPPDDRRGILQDVHWASGAIGYFPTYTLGNIIAAQLYKQIKEEIPGFSQLVANGNLKEILGWLRERIHKHGRFHGAEQLVKMATGQPISVDVFMSELKKRYTDIYKIVL